jgi:hypothetical protein
MILPIGKLKNLVEEAVDYRETPAVDAVLAELDALYAHIECLSQTIAYEEGERTRKVALAADILAQDLHRGFVRRSYDDDYLSRMLEEDALMSLNHKENT